MYGRQGYADDLDALYMKRATKTLGVFLEIYLEDVNNLRNIRF